MENEKEKFEVNEPIPKYNYVSQEEYLEAERSSLDKHEYYRGRIYAMEGASLRHNHIASNLYGIVIPFLKGKGCNMYGSDLRIHIPDNTVYTYPDASIICSDPDVTDNVTDTILNPSVIFEILSPSTKKYDKDTKFNLYKAIQSLKEYILIDSITVQVEIFSRDVSNSWSRTEFIQLTDSFKINTIGLTMKVEHLYDGITWQGRL